MEVCLVCARKVTGPSPLRGTIVDNVDPGRSEQAFASRVRNYFLMSLLGSTILYLLYNFQLHDTKYSHNMCVTIFVDR